MTASGQEVVHELAAHEGAVNAVAFVPLTSHAVTGGNDGQVQIHNLTNGELNRRLPGHTAPIYCLAVSADGRLLATGAQDNSVRLWNLPATKPVASLSTPEKGARALIPQAGAVLIAGASGMTQIELRRGQAAALAGAGAQLTCAAVTSNGTILATGGQNGDVVIWSTLLNRGLFQFRAAATPLLAIHHYGTSLITVDTAGTVTVWQTATLLNGQLPADQKELPQVRQFRLDIEKLRHVSFCRTTTMLAAGESAVAMVDFNSGKEIRRLDDSGGTGACAIRPDAQRVACCDENGIRVVNPSSGQVLQTIPLESHQVQSMQFSPDGRRLAAVSPNGIHLFEPATTSTAASYEFQQTLTSAERVSSLGFASDSTTLFVATADGRVSNWKVGKVGQTAQLAHSGAVYGMAISSDQKQLVTGGADQTVRVWELPAGRLKYQMRGHEGAIHAVTLNADNTLAVTAGADGTIRLWDVTGGRQLKELTRMDSTMYSVGFLGKDRLVVGGGDRRIHVLKAASGASIRALEGHKDFIHGLATVPQTGQFVSLGYSGQLRLWNTNLTNQQAIQVGGTGNCLALLPDGSHALVGGSDGVTRYVRLPK